jgi:hypothetical protein
MALCHLLLFNFLKEKRIKTMISNNINNIPCDPYVGVPEEDRIKIPLDKPLKDYPPVFPKLPLNLIEDRKKRIEKRFSITPLDFFYALPPTEQIRLTANGFDSEKMLKTLATSIIVGMVAGGTLGGVAYFVVTSQSPNPTNPLTWIKFGAAGGSFLGAVTGGFITKQLERKRIEINVLTSPLYQNWKKGLVKETYELYLHAYAHYSDPQDLRQFECSLSHNLPMIPVRSPNGHVYEKEYIERHLDEKWAAIKRAQESGSTQKYIDGLLETVCPMRCAPFHKEHLVYADDVAEQILSRLKTFIKEIRLDPNVDPILIDRVKEYIHHYVTTITNVSTAVVSRMVTELNELGATPDQLEKCTQVISNLVNFHVNQPIQSV